MVSKPKILFLDEATSALDNITQNIVCNTIEQMRATRIIIAHRLSTVIKCDRIIVLNEGSVAEQGTFEELMEKKGLFYELASRQMA
jgi:ATP-binding cassette subfamily C protein